MTSEQADLINKRYKVMEGDLKNTKSELKITRDSLLNSKSTIQTQYTTINKTVAKITYLRQENTNKVDSLQKKYNALIDSICKWALYPSIIFTTYQDTDVVFVMDLSHYFLTVDDAGIYMPEMTKSEFNKHQNAIKNKETDNGKRKYKSELIKMNFVDPSQQTKRMLLKYKLK